jgi:hypothetical protein
MQHVLQTAQGCRIRGMSPAFCDIAFCEINSSFVSFSEGKLLGGGGLKMFPAPCHFCAPLSLFPCAPWYLQPLSLCFMKKRWNEPDMARAKALLKRLYKKAPAVVASRSSGSLTPLRDCLERRARSRPCFPESLNLNLGELVATFSIGVLALGGGPPSNLAPLYF